MRHGRLFALVGFLLIFPMLAMVFFPIPVIAQDQDVGTPPVAITPGVPLTGPDFAVPTLTYDRCYDPLPITIGQYIYIEPGVNIRAGADGSTAIVWNTSYNQLDEEGKPLDPEDTFRLEAFVVAGPVCTRGYNWWQVRIAGNDGWVAEGRPTEPGGYLVRVPGYNLDLSCANVYNLEIGDTADILLNVRVRTDPDTNARVRTVAPAGTVANIVGGPECVDRVNWWLVTVTVADFTYTGWMAEGDDEITWLVPQDLPSYADGTLCGTPLDFPIGSIGYVNSFAELPRNLRSAPGLDGLFLYLLVDGVPFQIVGGPVCRNNLNWWQVSIQSSTPVVGWLAEGSQGVGYWLSIIDPNEYAK